MFKKLTEKLSSIIKEAVTEAVQQQQGTVDTKLQDEQYITRLAKHRLDQLGVVVSTEQMERPLHEKEYASASNIIKESAFKYVGDQLAQEQMHYAVSKSDTWLADLMARATLNGIYLYQERMQSLASVYESSKTQETDSFNKNDIT